MAILSLIPELPPRIAGRSGSLCCLRLDLPALSAAIDGALPGRGSAGRLTGKSVAKIVKRCVARIGLETDPYAGHSLRAGLVTAAARRRCRSTRSCSRPGTRAGRRWSTTSATRRSSRGMPRRRRGCDVRKNNEVSMTRDMDLIRSIRMQMDEATQAVPLDFV